MYSLRNRCAPSSGHASQPVDRAAGKLALLLEEEFGVPFALYDASSGCRIGGSDAQDAFGSEVSLTSDQVQRIVRDGEPVVQPRPGAHYAIQLLLYREGKPAWVAAAMLPALAKTEADTLIERERLRRWLHCVAQRLRPGKQAPAPVPDSAQAQLTTAWETILTLEQLFGQLRFHSHLEEDRQRLLASAFKLLRIQALVWVPRDHDAPIQIEGETALTPLEYRRLADHLVRLRDGPASGPILCNDVRARSWSGRFPQLVDLMAFPVQDRQLLGWIIALNKTAAHSGEASSVRLEGANRPPGFRRSDAAILFPFVSLFQMHARSSGRYQQSLNLLVGLARSLTSAIDAKDPYTYGHSERVGRIAVEIGRELGLDEHELSDIYLAGLLHDIGKIGVPEHILQKKDTLTAAEFDQIKQHVTIGHRILSGLDLIQNLLPGVLHHHESYDGGGYPHGLAGENIPALARLLAVADAYDAMSTARPYRDAIPPWRVQAILNEGAGKQWDPRMVAAFQRCKARIDALCQRGIGESLRQALSGRLEDDGSSLHLTGCLYPSVLA